MSSSKSTLEFLEGKWRTWYRNLDVNKDGIVSRADYLSSLSAYEKYYKTKVDEKMMEKMRKGFKVYWEEVILGKIAHKDEVTEDECIANMIKQYQDDVEGFRKMARYMFEGIFVAADAEGNGLVSFNEFYELFAAFGHGNEPVVKTLFQAYGPMENNKISLAAVTESWIDILIGEDQSKVNIVIDAFTKGAKPGTLAM